MTKYHVSPETGRPNICRADTKSCPIKDENGNPTPHFENKKDARKYHEQELAKTNPILQALSKAAKEQEPTKNNTSEKPQHKETQEEHEAKLLGEYFDAEIANEYKELSPKEMFEKREKYIQEMKHNDAFIKELKSKEQEAEELRKNGLVKRKMDAVNVRAGDIIQNSKFANGEWEYDNIKVVKVDYETDFDRKRTMIFTYENGKSGEYSAKSPMSIIRSSSIPIGVSPSRIHFEVNKAHKEALSQGILSSETSGSVLEALNDPHADYNMAYKAEKLADILEENNQHKVSMKLTSAAERIKLAYDENYEIQDAISVLYDDNTPSDLREKLTKEHPKSAATAERIRKFERESVDYN